MDTYSEYSVSNDCFCGGYIRQIQWPGVEASAGTMYGYMQPLPSLGEGELHT